jgi:N-ethylmaleimide reductase
MYKALFSPTKFGAIELSNRVVMAPMTRSRAGAGDAPTELNVEYYSQRASAGLIITEGTQPSANGKGYCRTPGIHTDEQIAGWRAVTDAVRAEGGNSVMQIMHVGRVASIHNKDKESETVAPSAIQAKGKMFTDSHGMVEFDMPRALNTNEIQSVVDEYRSATINALAAGCAGVELHATSGYLPAQFLSTGSNQRTDQYGGKVANRLRFVMEILEAMIDVQGADKVGIRICPGNPFNDLSDENPEQTFTHLLREISPMGLAYLHTIRMPEKITGVDNIKLSRKHFDGPLILNDSFDAEEADQFIANGQADAISFGRHFISNTNLVERFKQGLELESFNPKTLYSVGAEGYTSY